MEDHEHPEVRRERRRAEAIALRGTPERQAQIDELEAAKAAKKKKAKPRTGSGRKTPENSTEMFGYPWPEWFALRDAARAHLDATATAQATTTSAETWKAIETVIGRELPNQHLTLPTLLEYVAEDADTPRKMMPTSLILAAGQTDGPDLAFFRTASSLGEFGEPVPAVPKGETWTMTDTQRAFWTECVTAVHEQHRT